MDPFTAALLSALTSIGANVGGSALTDLLGMNPEQAAQQPSQAPTPQADPQQAAAAMQQATGGMGGGQAQAGMANQQQVLMQILQQLMQQNQMPLMGQLGQQPPQQF